jgi:hypothetical protein
MAMPPFIEELGKLGIKVVLPLDRVIYKYVSLETAEKIVSSNSLLFSPPTHFNDPFDLANSLIDTTFNDEMLKSWIDSASVGRFDENKKSAIYEKAIKDPQKVITILNDTLNKYKNEAGITCFSKSYKKTLMWSHYADKHAGVCLGFNIVPIGLSNFTLLEVNYTDTIKPLNYFLNKPIVLMYWLYTKSKIWSYEEEVRAVYSDRNGFVSFAKDCLREIHFGLRTSKSEREVFVARLKNFSYNINRITFMSMNSKTFDLQENELDY